MTNEIKNKIRWKNEIYKQFINSNKSHDSFLKLQNAISEVSANIAERKDEYHFKLARKLNNPKTSAKTYWSILKTFYNGRKIPLIPPLLINDQLVSDFKVKANHFNAFFSMQCTPLVNGSQIPDAVSFETNERLSSIDFSNDDTIKIIRSLDENKAHGHDDISKCLIKICDSTLVKPLFHYLSELYKCQYIPKYLEEI